MAETLFLSKIIAASLLSVALFITAFVKKNAVISTVIIIIAIAIFLMLSKL